MTRINLFRIATHRTAPATLDSLAWGKKNFDKKNFDTTTSTLILAAVLLACSLTVGCSSDKPQPVSSTTASPVAQPTTTTPAPTSPVEQAAAKPVHRKIVHRAPANLTYADKTSGVSFQYPRKYALKTGDAATELVSSSSVPMDFVQPGGITLAAVALPESAYPNSDLAAAFFNVNLNKSLTTDQCSQFPVPQPDPAAPATQATDQSPKPPTSKLMIGDMELQSSEASISGQTTNDPRDETSKYFHVFENGACYEFALKVATTQVANAQTTKTTVKHIDRDEVFQRLEKILATVKIDQEKAPEVNAEVKTSAMPTTTETPAQ
ncbi:MAG: hypothetical protein WB919_07035 [Candidatus Sulfotelmatobacter sp.]